jgi:hypothetical protein
LAEHWIAARRDLWERRLDRMGEVLADDDPEHRSGLRKVRRKP